MDDDLYIDVKWLKGVDNPKGDFLIKSWEV